MNATNNSSFNKSPGNIAKTFLLAFLSVQAIRQLVLVNEQYGAKKESRAGQVSAWMTITMTLLAGLLLYIKGPMPTSVALGALVVTALTSGSALLYDYMNNKSATAAEKNRLWFGIAHVLFALVVLIYFLMTAMG